MTDFIPRKWIIIIILFVVGSVPLAIGFTFLIQAVTFDEKLILDEELSKRGVSWNGIERVTNLNGTDLGNAEYNIKLRSNEVFAVDNPINVTFGVKFTRPLDAEKVYFVITESLSSLKGINATNYEKQLGFYNYMGSLFKLEKTSENTWENYGTFSVLTQGDFKVRGLFVINNEFATIPTSPTLVKIESYNAKLQSDTNRELRNQIEESKKTNNIIVGLTIVLTGLVPIGIAVEIISRYYFFEKDT